MLRHYIEYVQTNKIVVDVIVLPAYSRFIDALRAF
jgi:hypothetical protein